MATTRSNVPITSEAEELAFRHRTLVSAQRILEAELLSAARPANRDDLYIQRLRRLKIYLRNSIAALERRMEILGITTMNDTASTDDPQPLPPQETNGHALWLPPCESALPGD